MLLPNKYTCLEVILQDHLTGIKVCDKTFSDTDISFVISTIFAQFTNSFRNFFPWIMRIIFSYRPQYKTNFFILKMKMTITVLEDIFYVV